MLLEGELLLLVEFTLLPELILQDFGQLKYQAFDEVGHVNVAVQVAIELEYVAAIREDVRYVCQTSQQLGGFGLFTVKGSHNVAGEELPYQVDKSLFIELGERAHDAQGELQAQRVFGSY